MRHRPRLRRFRLAFHRWLGLPAGFVSLVLFLTGFRIWRLKHPRGVVEPASGEPTEPQMNTDTH